MTGSYYLWMKVLMKQIIVPLRTFAVPAPRKGSIELYSGYGRAAADGMEVHLRVQKERVRTDPLYQAEVPVSTCFDRGGYRFRIDGRMDGIFRHDMPHIEEIKSAASIKELVRRLTGNPLEHPYTLQLLTYGYLYWREHLIIPRLTFHLVSTRTGEAENLDVAMDRALYEHWLERRLDELALEAQCAEKRAARRRKIAADFPFPFDNPRPGQVELMSAIEQGMIQGDPILIQAPTGLGKTVGVLYPVLREALNRGQKVLYLTPKNSQHSVAEDAVARFQRAGSPVKSLSVTARSKICLKEEPLCDPDYCEYARDYYSKLHDHSIPGLLAKKRRLRARTFRTMGEQFQVCPFELQFDGALEPDVIICDYNYVFAPRSSLGKMDSLEVDQAGKPNLVIDEAHNLPSRGRECYSSSLSTLSLEKMRDEIRTIHPPFRREVEQLLDGCLRTIASCRGDERSKACRIVPPVEQFLDQEARLRSFLPRYLEGEEIKPRDVVLRLCLYWSQFTELLGFIAEEREEFFATYHPHPTGGTVRITCCDASALMKDRYDEYEQVVGFSATLKPFEYYANLSGLSIENLTTAEFLSPFPQERRKLLIIPQVSTRYADRERNYEKIADVIRRIIPLRSGNYFVFFPSFEFLERVAGIFRTPEGCVLLQQERNMKPAQVESVLEHLRTEEVPTVVFAVQGGSFAEGIDYAGDMVVGAFIVGPPLPSFDLEREIMREFYQIRYGAGFEYAYTIPAMAKAVQAAGRVIRSEKDRGLIVLMDSRFIEPDYSRAMPADWFETNATELVSDSILKEVAEFWKGGTTELPLPPSH